MLLNMLLLEKSPCSTKTGIKIKDSEFHSSKLIGRILVKNITNKQNKIIIRNDQEITLPRYR